MFLAWFSFSLEMFCLFYFSMITVGKYHIPPGDLFFACLEGDGNALFFEFYVETYGSYCWSPTLLPLYIVPSLMEYLLLLVFKQWSVS